MVRGFEIGERRRAAQMALQELEKLAEIAAIGLDRLGRGPQFAFEIAQPIGGGARRIGRGEDEGGFLHCGHAQSLGL